MKPKESAKCHQTFSSWVGSGDETTSQEISLMISSYIIGYLQVFSYVWLSKTPNMRLVIVVPSKYG